MVDLYLDRAPFGVYGKVCPVIAFTSLEVTFLTEGGELRVLSPCCGGEIITGSYGAICFSCRNLITPLRAPTVKLDFSANCIPYYRFWLATVNDILETQLWAHQLDHTVRSVLNQIGSTSAERERAISEMTSIELQMLVP